MISPQDIQTAITEMRKNINDIKNAKHALVDRSKRCIASSGTHFE